MRIGEAFREFKADFYLGNICNAIRNFFQNIKGSSGNREVFSSMESTSTANKPLEQKSAQSIGSSNFGSKSIDAPKLTSPESWFEARNQEMDGLKGRVGPDMKAFFDGPTPTADQTRDLENMTLGDAKQFLGIKDGEETRLDANERGRILKEEARGVYNEDMTGKIFTKAAERSPDQNNKIHYMEQKIERAVNLVKNSDFKAIPEPNPFD